METVREQRGERAADVLESGGEERVIAGGVRETEGQPWKHS